MVNAARFVVGVAVGAVALAACGDPPESTRAADGDLTVSSVAVTTSAPVDAITPESTEPASTSPGTAGAPPAASIQRCSEIAPVTTDVLSDPAQGNIDPVFNGVLLTYAAEHPDTFGGLWLDREAFGTIVLAFTDDPDAHLDAVRQRRPTSDDVHAVEPPPEITDDRPIGEWGVAFDVVQVQHTEAALTDAVSSLIEAVQPLVDTSVAAGADLLRNRTFIEISTPITTTELDAISLAVASVDGIDLGMICWNGQLVDEAQPPVTPGAALEVILLPGPDGSYPPDTPVECGGTAFELGDLATLTLAADVEAGLRSVLDDWLAGVEGQFWPQDNWDLLRVDAERATFIRIVPEGVAVVGAEMGANGWIWSGAGNGGPCDVRTALPPGIGQVDWVLDPQAPLDPTSTQIRVLATEQGCASGQEMGDRLLEPQIIETGDLVLIALGVIPQGGVQECPGNPAARVVIELQAPLGDREVRDGTNLGPITSFVSG